MAKRNVARKALTREPQYQALLDHRSSKGVATLGVMNNQVWHDDPRRLVFTLARYKFVSKLLSGKATALEVGCGDAFASRIVKQEVRELTVIDFDPLFVEDIRSRADPAWPMASAVHDMLAGPYPGTFEAIYSLDVLEHIPRKSEDLFIANVLASLSLHGVLIVGMPSLESQTHASPQSKEGHVNCKSGKEFKTLMERFFYNVFLFSMNDEVVHTGFYPMAHYLLAVCTGPRETTRRAPAR
jgi:2-polyprenyl-3-methyl-5-hydroxy-6-metoxy-1,4-benzoquinol methylase